MEVASATEYLGHRHVGARVQLAVQVGEHRVLERRELVVVEGHLEAVVIGGVNGVNGGVNGWR